MARPSEVLDLRKPQNQNPKSKEALEKVEAGVDNPEENIENLDQAIRQPQGDEALPLQNMPADFLTIPVSWKSPEVHRKLISHGWRKAIIVILVVMAFAALFWQGSILTALTFFAIAIVTSMHFWRELRHQDCEIHPHGVMVGERFYHYHDLDSFCIHYHPEGFHELSLKTGNFLNHYVKVPLGKQNPLEIREALMTYLPEERHEEGLEDWLRRKLGL